MKNKRPLAPRFLNQLDDYLLKNKPDTWSARTHLVLYYGLLFIIVLTSFCFLKPDDARTGSNVYIWGFLTGILAFIGFIVWLIYLLRFNVFKRFGIVSAGDKIKTFLLYFASVGVMVGAVYIPTFVESIRASKAFPDKEVVNDVNAMNLAICRLNYDSVQRSWDADSVLVRNQAQSSVAYDEDGRYIVRPNSFTIIDTAEFRIKKTESDSMIKINDSLYVLYKCPDYDFVNANFNYSRFEGLAFGNDTSILSSPDLYKIVFQKRNAFDKIATETQLDGLLKKYKIKSSVADSVRNAMDVVDGADYNISDRNFKGRIMYKYGLNEVNTSLFNINHRKYGWRALAPHTFLRIFYYTTLVITLLLFIFRHSTVRTFFLSIISGILLLILTSMFIAFAGTSTSMPMICYLLYIAIFFAFTVSIFYAKQRNVITGIGLNLFSFSIVFVPLIVTVLYYQVLKDADRLKDDYVFMLNGYPNEELHYFYAELAGAALLLILIETVLKRFYRKWYALPEA